MNDRVTVRRALVSVYAKDGVVELARALAACGVELISTGGTARALKEAGLAVTGVSDVTGFPEMMDGRVKTLHPKIHGGLLMRGDVPEHVAAAEAAGIAPIDLVVVNLYPFEEAAARPDASADACVELIDIGGPSMVRSAAKNHDRVAVVTDPADYAELLSGCVDGALTTGLAQRRRLAAKAFATTSHYDGAIAAWLERGATAPAAAAGEGLPQSIEGRWTKKQDLRYGENPHQRGALYLGRSSGGAPTVAWSRQLSGKELSFNNYLDADAALACVRDLDDVACVIVKHKNPCGAASAKDQLQAFEAAHAGDPLSAFGGIVAFNRPLDPETARAMATPDRFLEVIVAPSYEGDALEILRTGARWGKNVRILETGAWDRDATDGDEIEVRWIRGGLLVQDPDALGSYDLHGATRRAPTERELGDLRFAWQLIRHVTSNAIVFAKDRRLVAAGAGQQSRVDAVAIAARKGGEACRGAVMASDAFFPFPDGIVAAHEAGITAVVQPGGSIRDDAIVAACDERDLAMVLTGRRHFRH